MKLKCPVALVCLILLFALFYGFANAAGPDELIDRLTSVSKDKWAGMLSENKSFINDEFRKKAVEKAQAAYNRRDYGSSWMYMELGDQADYVSLNSTNYRAIYQFFLGRMLLRDNETDWVHRIADSIKSYAPYSDKGYFLKGKAYLARKEADNALVELRTAVEKAPDSEEGRLSLGYAYLLKSDTQSALLEFREVLRINPANVYAKDAVATLTGQGGPAWRSENEEAMTYFNAAEKLYSAGKYQDAIGNYEKAIGLDPNFAKAWVYMGDSYLSIGNSPKAVECYRKAIQLNPKDRQAHRFLGDVLEKMYDRTGDKKYLDEAIASFENAVRVDPSYATAASDLKRAKAKKGKGR
jgi:tetratricopeptide (TPR) repeat protein